MARQGGLKGKAFSSAPTPIARNEWATGGSETRPYTADSPRRAGRNVCPTITEDEGGATRQQSPARRARSSGSSGRIAEPRMS